MGKCDPGGQGNRADAHKSNSWELTVTCAPTATIGHEI